MSTPFDLCEECDPSRRGPTEWPSEQHVGVRFGDTGLGWSVLFNGCEVAGLTREAWAGQGGWVVFTCDPDGIASVCERCRQNLAVQLLRGHVEIRYRPGRD